MPGNWSGICNLNPKGDPMAKKKSKMSKLILNIIIFLMVAGVVAKFLPYIMFFLIILITANLSSWLSK